MKKLNDAPISECRRWYNDWVQRNATGKVLDVGKSTYWDYGFITIDKNPTLNPTFVGDIEDTGSPDEEFDTILCNGMYECVERPQKMVNEVMRILKRGGKAIFGFVGKSYIPYKPDWKFYDNNISFEGVIKRKDFSDYHFIICKKS